MVWNFSPDRPWWTKTRPWWIMNTAVWINLHVDWQLRNPHLSYKYKRKLTAGPKSTDHRISLHINQLDLRVPIIESAYILIKVSGIEPDFPYIVSRLLIAEQFLYLYQSLISIVMLHDCVVFLSNRIAESIYTLVMFGDFKIIYIAFYERL